MRLFSVFIFLASLAATTAQEVRWNPPGGTLGEGQISQLELYFDQCSPKGEVKLPPIDGLELSPPSRNEQMSVVNFSISRTVSLVYQVRPTRKGRIEIPSFEIQTNKGAITVKTASFETGKATVGSSNTAISDVVKSTLRMVPDKVWQGQIFEVIHDVVFDTRFNASVNDVKLNWKPQGIVYEEWAKPIAIPGDENPNGRNHRITTRAIALEPGSRNVDSLQRLVNIAVGSRGFGIFSQSSVEQAQVETDTPHIEVRPLPQPAPADFKGAIGQFSLESRLQPATVSVGEPLTWTLELKGNGNWPSNPSLPERDVAADLKVIQPKSKRTLAEGKLFEGSLVEDVVAVPSRPGTYTFGPVTYSYFDPAAGKYVTITTPVHTVTVRPAAPGAASFQPLPTPSPSGVEPILQSPGGSSSSPLLPHDPLPGHASGWRPFSFGIASCLYLLPLLAALVTWLTLAAGFARMRDLQRLRREALTEILSIIARLRLHPDSTERNSLIRDWQHAAAVIGQMPQAAPTTRHWSGSLGEDWKQLWEESELALYAGSFGLPLDWIDRADAAARAVRLPTRSPWVFLAPRNLFPLVLLAGILTAPGADPLVDYQKGNFSDAVSAWKNDVEASPRDWKARNNLGLALAQQNRWSEAAALWASAHVLAPRNTDAEWNLRTAINRVPALDPALSALAYPELIHRPAFFLSPLAWQFVGILGTTAFGAALILVLMRNYGRGPRAWPPLIPTLIISGFIFFLGSQLALITWGPWASPDAIVLAAPGSLRSIPSDITESQQTRAMAPGAVAVIEGTFLKDWIRVRLPSGETGWLRREETVPVYDIPKLNITQK